MKTVHEYFTNARIPICVFVVHSWMVVASEDAERIHESYKEKDSVMCRVLFFVAYPYFSLLSRTA